MKKIICTVTNDLNFDQRMIRICTSLSKAGYEVQLIGRELPFSRPLPAMPFRMRRFRLFFNKGKLFYLAFNVRLFFFLFFNRFDVVCAVDLDTLLPGFVVALLRRKICVYDAHEYFPEVPEVVERPLVKKAWEAVARLIIPRLQFACTVCESLAAIFQEKYGTPFEVIRNVPFGRPGLEVDITSKLTKKPFVLLYQGVLNEGRGLEESIEALHLSPDTELWLAGEGDLSKELRAQVTSLGLETRVKFLGRVAPEQLAILTPQAHLGLNLLQNKGLNYYYSLANKAFDYIHAGIPSLNMDFPEYQRINLEHEVFLLLKNLDPVSIAKAVEQLRADSDVYGKMAANCREAAKVYIWEEEEKRLIAFYQKIR